MTTMKQIAQCVGVSVSTVSLVLNGRDGGRVKPQIAQRVREAADEMGYQPNALARSLRTSRTHIVGFISVEVATTPYAGGMIQGAQDALSALGYQWGHPETRPAPRGGAGRPARRGARRRRTTRRQ
ncbi:MAG: LacI family transcriptional regulator, partial [Bifidobacterium castoris]|nr:LacI family transcriptional regulator [Bifidobacterium castoris]